MDFLGKSIHQEADLLGKPHFSYFRLGVLVGTFRRTEDSALCKDLLSFSEELDNEVPAL
jgi:hypothetical protein